MKPYLHRLVAAASLAVAIGPMPSPSAAVAVTVAVENGQPPQARLLGLLREWRGQAARPVDLQAILPAPKNTRMSTAPRPSRPTSSAART